MVSNYKQVTQFAQAEDIEVYLSTLHNWASTGDPQAYIKLGEYYLAQNNHDEAQKNFIQAGIKGH